MKYATPNLYRRINSLQASVNDTPRPFIKFVKENLGHKDLVGAEIGVSIGDNAQSILDELSIEKLFLIDPYHKGNNNTFFLGSDNLRILTSRMNIPEVYGNTSFKNIGTKKQNKLTSEETYQYVLDRFKDYSNVEIINETSRNALKYVDIASLDFVYIDGLHDYSNVYFDINSWTEKVKLKGIVAGHDVHWNDVLQGAIDFCFNYDYHLNIAFPDWFFIKR